MSENINGWMERFGGFYSKDGAAARSVMKIDAPMLSTTTGMFNAIYGAEAFSQLNQEANAWNALPKKPHTKSGFRVITARGFTLGTGGVADGGSVGDTVKSTVAEGVAKPKLSHTPFEIGIMTDLLDGDDRYTFEEERRIKSEDHILDINAQLLGDVGTVAGDNFESIDRVCSSQSEETLEDAGDADIYGFDRSASTAYDAYVDHNSGTDRVLTQAIIRTAINTIKSNSGRIPKVILTGYDTQEKIDALYEGQTRYEATRVSVSVNGVSTQNGSDVGLAAQSIFGIPILQDANVVQDTISRIYFLNTDFIWLSIALPTQFSMSENVLDRGVLTKKAMYLTIGELWCTMFSAQGKIRDLK